MELQFINHDKLFIDRTNMRHGRKPDVADMLPSVRKRGIIVPLVVRPANEDGRSGIVAGSRRWTTNGIVREEGIDHGPLPCAILAPGDDADAIEASLIENIARLDADEVTQWETFTRLVKEGRDVADLSTTFAIPELGVRRILALGNLLPRIRTLYRNEAIDGTTVRHLTMASKSQQRSWLALFDDPSAYTPTGHQLKSWLFGGRSIPVRHALFDTDGTKGIVADLFGEDRYFADRDAFWTAQNAAIEERRVAYMAAGWPDAVIVPPSETFHSWEHERAPKRRGGRVYIEVRDSGEVSFHEGYVTRKEARRIEKGETIEEPSRPPRPEVTGSMQTYLDLHRHAAVRAQLTRHPKVALRLMVAHAIVGSHLWNVRPEPQTARADGTKESVENSRSEADFDAKRRAVLALLDFSPEEPTVTGGNGDGFDLVAVFLRLLNLPDRAVMDVVAIVIGETLAAGSAAVEAVGQEIGVDMGSVWQADDAFFGLIRDREVLTALVIEVAGATVAGANAGEKANTLKTIVRDHLAGSGGRQKVERWVPKWMAFPPAAYTARGGVGTVAKAIAVAAARLQPEPDPAGPAVVLALPAPSPVTPVEPERAAA